MSNVLLVTTVPGAGDRVGDALREVLGDAEIVRVVAPAADVSWLDWLRPAVLGGCESA